MIKYPTVEDILREGYRDAGYITKAGHRVYCDFTNPPDAIRYHLVKADGECVWQSPRIHPIEDITILEAIAKCLGVSVTEE